MITVLEERFMTRLPNLLVELTQSIEKLSKGNGRFVEIKYLANLGEEETIINLDNVLHIKPCTDIQKGIIVFSNGTSMQIPLSEYERLKQMLKK